MLNDAGVRGDGEWVLGWKVLRGSYSAPQRDREMPTEFHSGQFHMHLDFVGSFLLNIEVVHSGFTGFVCQHPSFRLVSACFSPCGSQLVG